MEVAIIAIRRRRMVEERELRIRLLRLHRRQLRDAMNPFQVDEEYFRSIFRLSQGLTLRLIEILRPLIRPLRRPQLPLHLQILCALRFFASGSYQMGLSLHWMHASSQTTTSRIISKVAIALNQIADQYIRFPQTRQERINVSNRFLRLNPIQNILGLIDCFVVKFIRPSQNEEAFFHHRHGTSMNVQVISDSDYVIQNIRICPGSNNDRHIWNFSDVKLYLEHLRMNAAVVQNEGYYYLLGDSGYTPSKILLTPIVDANEGSPEYRYTEEHVRTRVRVEQTFGVYINSWRCISRQRVLHYSPEKVALFINASAVLHNYRRLNGEPFLNNEHNPLAYDGNQDYDGSYEAGVDERQHILQQYYI